MAFKFIAFFACIAVASAGLIAAPLAAVATPVLAKSEEHDPHPQYSFGYDVQDAISGDNKNQVETRDGDIVHGQYSLNDADGYRRTVDYTSDPLNGFNAVVRREPLGAIAVKAVAASPALIKAAPAPLAYAATPALIHHAPALIKSAPAPLAYSAAPKIIHAAPAPLAYAHAPAPLAYAHAPALLGSHTLIKSAPVLSYAAAPALVKSYAAAPAVSYAAAAPALVKTSFSSPLISYAY